MDVAFQIRDTLGVGHLGGNLRLHCPGSLLVRWLETLLVPFYCTLGNYYGHYSGIFVRRDVYERVSRVPESP